MSDTRRDCQGRYDPTSPDWERYGWNKKIKSEKHHKRDRNSRYGRRRSAKKSHCFHGGASYGHDWKNSRHNLLKKVEALQLKEYLEFVN